MNLVIQQKTFLVRKWLWYRIILQCKTLEEENSILKETSHKLESDLARYKSRCNILDREKSQANAALLDALAEVKVS